MLRAYGTDQLCQLRAWPRPASMLLQRGIVNQHQSHLIGNRKRTTHTEEKVIQLLAESGNREAQAHQQDEAQQHRVKPDPSTPSDGPRGLRTRIGEELHFSNRKSASLFKQSADHQINSQTARFLVKSFPFDAQSASRLGLVARVLLQHEQDVLPL